MAAAVRLAKLRHEVTLVEQEGAPGGALRPVEHEGFAWETVDLTVLPAVVRDLFRKSGRPLEAELDLVERPVLREHRFADGSSLALPGSSRAAQIAAFDALAPGAGRAWADHVAAYSATWETLRRHYLEVPPADPLPRDVARLLGSRESLRRRLRRALPDERLRMVAAHPYVAAGHDPRDVPAWAGLVAYLEQRFGGWTARSDDGAGLGSALADALTRRLATRKVTVLTGVTARDLVEREGRVAAVATDTGTLDADVVVVAVDPRRLPALAPAIRRTTPAMPPVLACVGLRADEVPHLEHEVVLHGEPELTLRPGGRTPDAGTVAWTVHARGRIAEDVLVALARRGIDVRRHVVARVDLSPRDLVERWHGSPLGVQWQGRRTPRLGPRTPVAGVYAVGAAATPGPGLPFAGLTAAVVAQLVGPA